MIASEKLSIDDVSDHLISAYTKKLNSVCSAVSVQLYQIFLTLFFDDFVFAFSMYMTFLYCYI